MVSTLRMQAEQMRNIVESLHPDLLSDGHEREARAVYCDLS